MTPGARAWRLGIAVVACVVIVVVLTQLFVRAMTGT